MKDGEHINSGKLDCYKELLSSSEKSEIIIETVVEKIAKSIGMHIIDFSKKKTKVIYINQVKTEKDILMLKKPMKIYIKRFAGGFSVLQIDTSLVVFASSFRKALTKFQKAFFDNYQKYLLTDLSINSEGKAFKNFYNSLVAQHPGNR